MSKSEKKEIASLKAQLTKLQNKTGPMTANKRMENTKKGLEFFTGKLGLKVVRDGFKVKLPTKNGVKEYDALEFSNGRIGVVLGWGGVKYAWAKPV